MSTGGTAGDVQWDSPATPARPAGERLSWNDFTKASQCLADQVRESGFKPDLILAISRGGLAPAATLAYALGVRRTATVNVQFYDAPEHHARAPLLLPPLLQLGDLRDAHILVVDDVADSGATLSLVRGLTSKVAAEVRCAALYEKPQSSAACEYVWSRTADWIEFPWSPRPKHS